MRDSKHAAVQSIETTKNLKQTKNIMRDKNADPFGADNLTLHVVAHTPGWVQSNGGVDAVARAVAKIAHSGKTSCSRTHISNPLTLSHQASAQPLALALWGCRSADPLRIVVPVLPPCILLLLALVTQIRRGGGGILAATCYSGGVFARRTHSTGTACTQRQLLANHYIVYPGNTPENHPPTEACMIHSKQHRGCGIQDPGIRGKHQIQTKSPWCTSRGCRVQNSGPWDPWLLVVKNSNFLHSTSIQSHPKAAKQIAHPKRVNPGTKMVM